MFTLADAERERTVLIERRRLAENVDRALRRTESQEALAREALGQAAAVLRRGRALEILGFVRFGDYCRERLGCSVRQLQTMAQVVRRLAELPAIRAAFMEGDLSWTQARLLAGVATPADEAAWLARAIGTTVRELRAVVEAHVAAGRGDAALVRDEDAGATLDDEPVVRVRLACPARLRVLWRYAVELARRMAGENGPCWQAIEAIAAEGLSGASTAARRAAADCPTPWRHQRRRRNVLDAGAETRGQTGAARRGRGAARPQARRPPAGAGFSPGERTRPGVGEAEGSADAQFLRSSETFDAACAEVAALAADLEGLDPVALDARVCAIDRALRTGDARIGHLLALLTSLGLHRTLGFASLDDYVAERLALCVRKARALVTMDRACARALAFAAAYHGGRISWVQALRLLPVLDRTTDAAWIARADRVTIRRLEIEVAWVLDRRDLLGPDAGLAPPPPDTFLGPAGAAARAMWDEAPGGAPEAAPKGETAPPIAADPAAPGGSAAVPKDVTPAASAVQNRALQMDAREICDAEIDFVGPESVATLWRGALIALSPPGAPRWVGLACLLRHVIAEWERQPRLRDPVLARDGFLCMVPGCSGRRNLQDHHLRFRSRGDGNERANRTTVCAAHHLRAIHRGRVRAWGRAPAPIRWDLGVRPTGPPFLRLVGDRYL